MLKLKTSASVSAAAMSSAKRYGANNYAPKEVVIERALGCKVWDPEGNEYYDMLSAYSAHNLGHSHPEIISAAKDQLDKVTLTSRAFYSANFGEFCQKLAEFTGKEAVLPMNTGAEAVETALKLARKWGAEVKGVANGKQEIITCKNNFHGRTISIISFSTDDEATGNYGPFTNGFVSVEYGNADALEAAINENTVAFLVEPIQGEAGIILPPEGYLKKVREICSRKGILFMADEVQTGFSRTGEMFACWNEGVVPDVYIMGKALGGGVMPVSAIAADKSIMDVFTPGTHGSTFGGNPLACAVAMKALEIFKRDNYPAMSKAKGEYMMSRFKEIENDDIAEIRGKGMLFGIEFKSCAKGYVKKLIENGVLAKETHDNIIRFAPPIMIDMEDLEDACDIIVDALSE